MPLIYLDHAATTPLDPVVLEGMLPWMAADSGFGNPASASHAFGAEAASAVERARRQVASLLQAPPEGAIFTGSATEAINLAILGRLRFAMQRGRGRHIITCATEHSAVLAACEQAQREGAELSVLPVDAAGRISLAELRSELRDDTALVSLMLVNNETGVLHDIPAVATALREHSAMLHVDATQAIGKLPVQVPALGADLLSLSAHKFHGPKGVGVLWRCPRPRLRLQPLQFGGGQEGGERPGTQAVHQIVGLGLACEQAGQYLGSEGPRLKALRDRLEQGLFDAGIPVQCNGAGPRAPHISNLSFPGVHGEALLAEVGEELAIAAGSACTSRSGRGSHVLRAMGVGDAALLSAFRFSLGRGSREADVDQAVSVFSRAVRRLLAISPEAAGVARRA
ncbi:cysteine desulfurase [Methylonatrum kenyense]|uniref:cysteine desulfurase family protein n=1 Tax=Methylonatrum kenyense TaxID=455253 RepID=UPI0020BEF2D1|nr:cysteine desulfurase family protein [Methylonatrum kenyense]MCK8515545.1 cysteine desulfurase [Methylonatrum kenyense]